MISCSVVTSREHGATEPYFWRYEIQLLMLLQPIIILTSSFVLLPTVQIPFSSSTYRRRCWRKLLRLVFQSVKIKDCFIIKLSRIVLSVNYQGLSDCFIIKLSRIILALNYQGLFYHLLSRIILSLNHKGLFHH